MTTHSDTVLLVGTIVMLMANTIEQRTRKSLMVMLMINHLIPWMPDRATTSPTWAPRWRFAGACTSFAQGQGEAQGQRRPHGAVTGHCHLRGGRVGPYGENFQAAAVDFSTMSTNEDSSTLARKAENHGLHETLVKGGWITGTGWGQEYVEFGIRATASPASTKSGNTCRTTACSASWPSPASSGSWACGCLSPCSLYCERAHPEGCPEDPVIRTCALTGSGLEVVCSNQMYGDMGLQSQTTLFMMASSIAVAGRLAIPTGAWGKKKAPAGSGRANTIPPMKSAPRA